MHGEGSVQGLAHSVLLMGSSLVTFLFIITVVNRPIPFRALFLGSLGSGCQVLLVLSLSVRSFVHSSVKSLLCARDPGSRFPE